MQNFSRRYHSSHVFLMLHTTWRESSSVSRAGREFHKPLRRIVVHFARVLEKSSNLPAGDASSRSFSLARFGGAWLKHRAGGWWRSSKKIPRMTSAKVDAFRGENEKILQRRLSSWSLVRADRGWSDSFSLERMLRARGLCNPRATNVAGMSISREVSEIRECDTGGVLN